MDLATVVSVLVSVLLLHESQGHEHTHSGDAAAVLVLLFVVLGVDDDAALIPPPFVLFALVLFVILVVQFLARDCTDTLHKRTPSHHFYVLSSTNPTYPLGHQPNI